MNNDISKKDLYESVKTLLEMESKTIHLNQHKLYTLCSIAFQYFLYKSTKDIGHYIIRFEDNYLAQKLVKKSKDESTRRFLNALMLPRRLKYGQSVFHLDFFNIATWNSTNDIPQHKIKGALIVKNPSEIPMIELDEETRDQLANLPRNYYLTSLQEFVPKNIIIAYDHTFDNSEIVRFPFIKDKENNTLQGVTIADGVILDGSD